MIVKIFKGFILWSSIETGNVLKDFIWIETLGESAPPHRHFDEHPGCYWMMLK